MSKRKHKVSKLKIIFIDIDGPLIPARAYMLPKKHNHGPFVMDFDPVAVSLLNHLAENCGWKFVIHSSWLRVWGPEATLEHCISEGLDKKHFYKDPLTDVTLHWRYDRVARFLEQHPYITDYVIIDDEEYKPGIEFEHIKGLEDHLLLIDFDEGFLMKNFRQIKDGNWRNKYAEGL